jgi:hypothetical protein
MKKELTLSIHEFMEVQRGNVTYKDLENEKIEKMAGIILDNPQAKRITIAFIASINMTMMEQMAFAGEVENAVSALNAAQCKIVTVMQYAVYSVSVICCIFDLAKSLLSHEKGDTLSIVLKYLFIVIAVKVSPSAFKMVQELF